MGSIWSQNDASVPDDVNVVDSPPLTAKKRKRSLHQDANPTESFGSGPDTTPSQVMDSTPDGKLHRYIVRCSSIFWCTKKDITKRLTKLKAMPPYGGLHKISKWEYFFISFPNKTCAEKGVEVLSAHSFRGEPWVVSISAEHSAKRMRIDETVANTNVNMPEDFCPSAADVTAKWRNIPYEEQILRKQRKWKKSLQLVTKNLCKEVREKGCIEWLDQVIAGEKGKGVPICCPLEDVIYAENNESRMFYRNKNEFTIGLSPDACGKHHDFHKSELTIGYALGLVRNGEVFIGEVDENCLTTSKMAIGISRVLSPIIRALNRPVYDKRTHKGYWRQITCREGMRTGEVIVSIVVNPFDYDTTEDKASIEADEYCRTTIVLALCEHFGPEVKFGVFWQPSSLKSAVSSEIPAVHLYGIEALHEEMCGLRFRVQPTAFFQVNTIMAEKLYRLIGDLAQVDKDTVVLDVCCGTGTIGLSLAHRVHSVVGIEMNESAVADAEYNARLNGISNASFIVGKVENKIHDAIRSIEGKRECVVVLDPPRAGLPMSVVSAVRAMPAVRRLLYVSCVPTNFWRNAIGFCRPRSKAFRLEPFRPVKAYGIDLFPHTDHGEMAVLLERD